MSQPFLIVGLPRSRTAWLAAVANTIPGAICYHEPMETFPSWQASLVLWRSSTRDYVGISDSTLGFHLSEILETWKPRTLVVKRNPQEVVGSLNSIGIGGDQRRYCNLLSQRILACEGHELVKTILFEKLSEVQAVRSCLWHLMPGASIDGDKLGVMQRLNVQADMRHVRRTVEQRKPDARALLGHDVYAEVCV